MEAELRPVEGDACCPRCSTLCRYARDVADALGLRDWAVEVDHEPPRDEAELATVTLHPERKQLRLRICRRWPFLDEEERRHALVHELVHAHLRDLFETVKGTAREEFSGVAYRVYEGAVRRDIERAVDALAAVVAGAMPLPSDPQG